MKEYTVVLVIVSILLLGCFSSKSVVEISNQSIVNQAQSEFPGYTVEQYEGGKLLYETKCNLCHAIKNPKNYEKEEWAKLVPDMSEKANKKKGADLSEEDQILIYQYVIASKM